MSDINGDISIKINIFTHKAMAYRAEVVLYVVQEQPDGGKCYREVYSFAEVYERTRIKGVCKAVVTRAADWLFENGFKGLVTFSGNAAGDVRSVTSGAGITAYNTGESDLYLSPSKDWYEEQKEAAVIG